MSNHEVAFAQGILVRYLLILILQYNIKISVCQTPNSWPDSSTGALCHALPCNEVLRHTFFISVLLLTCFTKQFKARETDEHLTLLYRKTPKIAVIIPRTLVLVTGLRSIIRDTVITIILLVAFATE